MEPAHRVLRLLDLEPLAAPRGPLRPAGPLLSWSHRYLGDDESAPALRGKPGRRQLWLAEREAAESLTSLPSRTRDSYEPATGSARHLRFEGTEQEPTRARDLIACPASREPRSCASTEGAMRYELAAHSRTTGIGHERSRLRAACCATIAPQSTPTESGYRPPEGGSP